MSESRQFLFAALMLADTRLDNRPEAAAPPPLDPALVIDTAATTPDVAAERLVQAILAHVRPRPATALDGAQL